MSTALSQIGDRLLSRLLPKQQAGACDYCQGPCASKYVVVCSGGRLELLYCHHRYSCQCGCVPYSCTYQGDLGAC
ncbi:hypothetical protein GCM10023170_071850 [Phytohabitans houttuyneae]|jgi:hypothetical protein